MSTIIQMRYYVQGMYVDRFDKNNDPSKPSKSWTRTWQLWRDCSDLESAMAYYRTGMKVRNPNEYSGFNDLRVVEVEMHMAVLTTK